MIFTRKALNFNKWGAFLVNTKFGMGSKYHSKIGNITAPKSMI